MTQRASTICHACGAEMPADAARCPECGAERVDEGLDDLMAAEVLRGGTLQGERRLSSHRPTVALDASAAAHLAQSARQDGPRHRATEFVDLNSIGSLESVTRDPTIGAVEGFAPVSSSAAPRVRPPRAWARSAPLAVIGSIAIGAFAFVAWRFAGRMAVEAQAEPPPVVATGRVVILPAATVQIGMSEDNKEGYLAACWRISQNTNTECRVTWLEDQGEFPGREQAFGELAVHAYEVSNADWRECVDAGACPEQDWDGCRYFGIGDRYRLGEPVPDAVRGPAHPATCVTFDEAQAWCAWQGMRLPTNDEWERLARGGDDRMYPWGNFWAPALLNWAEADALGYPVAGRLDGAELTAPVTDYADGATPEGVFNAYGNVEEWTVPGDDIDDGMATMRGGSYALDLASTRMTRIREARADDRRTTIGFRCVGDP